jgi:hypothetical protein
MMMTSNYGNNTVETKVIMAQVFVFTQAQHPLVTMHGHK